MNLSCINKVLDVVILSRAFTVVPFSSAFFQSGIAHGILDNIAGISPPISCIDSRARNMGVCSLFMDIFFVFILSVPGYSGYLL